MFPVRQVQSTRHRLGAYLNVLLRLTVVLSVLALLSFGLLKSGIFPKIYSKALKKILVTIERESGRPFNHDQAELIYSGEFGLKLKGFSMLLSGERKEWMRASIAQLTFDLASIFLGRIWIDPLMLKEPQVHLTGGLLEAGRWQAFLEQSLNVEKIQGVERVEHVKYLHPKTWQYPVRRVSIKDGRVLTRLSENSLLPKEFFFPQLYLRRSSLKGAWDISGIYEPEGFLGLKTIFKGNYDVDKRMLKIQASIKNHPVNVKALVNFKKDRIKWEMMSQIQGLEAKELFKWTNSEESQWIDGIVTTRLEGLGEGLDEATLSRLNTSFRGAFDVRDGVFLGRDFLPRILQQVLVLSQAEGEGALSAEEVLRGLKSVSELTSSPDTPFDIFQAKFIASQGTVQLEGIRLQHEAYFIEGSGSVWLDKQEIDLRARLVMMARVSDRFVQKYPHLRDLLNEVGRIVVPFGLRGSVEAANVYPDKDYLKMAMGLSYRNRTLVPTDVVEEDPLDSIQNEIYAEEFYEEFDKREREDSIIGDYPDEAEWEQLEDELNQFLEEENKGKESAMSLALEDNQGASGQRNSWAEDIERSLDEDF